MNNQNRSQAREFAFQFLFHLQLPIFEDAKRQLIESTDDDLLRELYNDLRESIPNKLSGEPENYALNLIKSALKNYQSIEDQIRPRLKNWKLERVSKVDFSILLVATAELIYLEETPKKVVINEAIELSKRFSAQESNAFINGLLDQIHKADL